MNLEDDDNDGIKSFLDIIITDHSNLILIMMELIYPSCSKALVRTLSDYWSLNLLQYHPV